MKWDRAFMQKGAELEQFVRNYLADPKRRCALICGAGFDPRTLRLPELLAAAGVKPAALCLREERPKPQPGLRPIADRHAAELQRLFPTCTVASVQIFDSGDSVIGGRRVVPIVDQFVNAAQTEQPVTDVLVDISALSCGIFFPIFARLLGRIEQESLPWNLHLFVAENPQIDLKIRGEAADTVSHIHGFRSADSLSQTDEHAVLWVPVLAEDNDTQMRQIHSVISQPASALDISPIVPFPGLDPRRPDVLIEHYRELIGDWEVDLRYLLYAAESDPLDSYRSISAIDQSRAETYGELGGSSTIVSPLGSKMLSVGLMLAALERKLRVMYVESRGYEELAMPVIGAAPGEPLTLTHLWLHGEIYRARH